MVAATIERDFREKVSAKVRLAQEGVDRYRVFTPFLFEDGDHLAIVLKKQRSNWTLSDEGHTFMHLTYDLDEKDIRRERRKARELRQTQWWKRQLAKGKCYYCGKPAAPGELTMDHIVPVARGGRTSKGNVVTACKPCNNRKKQLLPIEWTEYLERLRADPDRAAE